MRAEEAYSQAPPSPYSSLQERDFEVSKPSQNFRLNRMSPWKESELWGTALVHIKLNHIMNFGIQTVCQLNCLRTMNAASVKRKNMEIETITILGLAEKKK